MNDVRPRKLGALPAQIDVPAGWVMRANGGGFFLDDDSGRNRLALWLEPTNDSLLDRLAGPGVTVTESVLPSGARSCVRTGDSGVAVFVALALPNGQNLVCSSTPELEGLCSSLRPLVP